MSSNMDRLVDRIIRNIEYKEEDHYESITITTQDGHKFKITAAGDSLLFDELTCKHCKAEEGTWFSRVVTEEQYGSYHCNACGKEV